MSTLEILCKALQWNGGTEKDIKRETGIDVKQLESVPFWDSPIFEFGCAAGFIAGKQNSIVAHEYYHRGDLHYWHGVITGYKKGIES